MNIIDILLSIKEKSKKYHWCIVYKDKNSKSVFFHIKRIGYNYKVEIGYISSLVQVHQCSTDRQYICHVNISIQGIIDYYKEFILILNEIDSICNCTKINDRIIIDFNERGYLSDDKSKPILELVKVSSYDENSIF